VKGVSPELGLFVRAERATVHDFTELEDLHVERTTDVTERKPYEYAQARFNVGGARDKRAHLARPRQKPGVCAIARTRISLSSSANTTAQGDRRRTNPADVELLGNVRRGRPRLWPRCDAKKRFANVAHEIDPEVLPERFVRLSCGLKLLGGSSSKVIGLVIAAGAWTRPSSALRSHRDQPIHGALHARRVE
jgi:hypothetical protein